MDIGTGNVCLGLSPAPVPAPAPASSNAGPGRQQGWLKGLGSQLLLWVPA